MMSPQPGYSGVDPSTQNKKKITIAGVSALLLLAVVGTVATVMTRNTSPSSSTPTSSSSSPTSTTSVKAIQSICQPTDYKQQCEDSLSKSAGNTTDPKQLVQAAFQITMDRIHDALNRSKVLQDAATDPRTKSALDTCGQLMDYASDELKTSIDQLGDLDITKVDVIVNDLKVWLSAVVTYQETCIDGFENTTGDAAEAMKKALTASSQLTSNALAIIDNISSVLTSFDLSFLNRRLLSHEDNGIPDWVHSKRMLLDGSTDVKPDLVVAQDGSGDFKTINEALAKVPPKSAKFVIYVKAGIYKEQVVVARTVTNLMMYGDGPTKTVITGRLNFIDGTPTFKTATFGVIGDGFIAKSMGFENSAGAEKHQAVALRVQSDHSIFYNCQMDGYQDTLYAHTKRQFYRDCTVSGTIDFIFGDSATVFQNCKFVVRKPMANQQTIITAQGRKDVRQPSGMVLHNCTLTADPAYLPVANKEKAYLGRPWKEYSRTIIMQSEIDAFISPDGWLPWMGTFGLNTLFYSEFDNRGPGAIKDSRVKWQGLKAISVDDAMKYTVESFIEGDLWLKPTGVPYIPGLLPLSEQGRMH